jgi:hypothetical protein
MEYSHVQKLRYGIRHTMKEKRKDEKKEERIHAVVRNED